MQKSAWWLLADGSLSLQSTDRDVRGQAMQLRYDSEADVIFLSLRPAAGGEAGGRRLDDARVAHLDQAGHVFAYEFLDASRGVSLAGIDSEDARRIREVIKPVIQLSIA